MCGVRTLALTMNHTNQFIFFYELNTATDEMQKNYVHTSPAPQLSHNNHQQQHQPTMETPPAKCTDDNESDNISNASENQNERQSSQYNGVVLHRNIADTNNESIQITDAEQNNAATVIHSNINE